MATSHPRSENYANALCHSTANHRLVPAPTGIESLDSFASVTNAQQVTSLKHVTVIHYRNPTRNTTDKVRLSGFPGSYSEYHRQGETFRIPMNAAIYLAYTTKILLGNLRDTHSSSVACRTDMVVNHAHS